MFRLFVLSVLSLTSSLTFLKTSFKSSIERDAEFQFLTEAVNSSHAFLRPPFILDPFTTARQYIDTEQMGEDSRIIVGILVENFSKYSLENPKTSKTTCTYNREINEPLPVLPGSSQLFAVDNQGTKHRGVCGTFSWQIHKPDGSAVRSLDVGRRLVVTYHVPYTGSCGDDGRVNSFSLNIWHAYLNSSDHWTKPELVETFFSTDHSAGSTASFSDDGSEAFASFDEGKFLLYGVMERGCKPMLTVRIAPGSRNGKMLWAREERKEKVDKWVDTRVKLFTETNPNNPSHKEKSDKKEEEEEVPTNYFSLPWVLSLSLAVSLGFIAVILSISAYTSIRRRRGQHRSAAI